MRRTGAPALREALFSPLDLVPPLFFTLILGVPVLIVFQVAHALAGWPPRTALPPVLGVVYLVVLCLWIREKVQGRAHARTHRENLKRDLAQGEAEVARVQPLEAIASCVEVSEEAPDEWESWGAFIFRLSPSRAIALFEGTCRGGDWPNADFEIIRFPNSKIVYELVGHGPRLALSGQSDEWLLDKGYVEGEPLTLDWTDIVSRCS